MKIINILRRMWKHRTTPPVEKSIESLKGKITELEQRKQLDLETIKGAHLIIAVLSADIASHQQSVAKADDAIAALELVVGEREQAEADQCQK